jgi:hypothetical protein
MASLVEDLRKLSDEEMAQVLSQLSPEDIAKVEQELAAPKGPPPTREEGRAKAAELQKLAESEMFKAKLGGAVGEGLQEAGGMISDVAGRGLDYIGGATRTLAAHSPVGLAARTLLGDEKLSDIAQSAPQDILQTLVGKAPTTAAILERAGAPEGPSMTLPVLGKVTTRGGVGLAGDILSDPTAALRKAGVFGAAQAGMKSGMQRAGQSLYESGLKRADFVGKKMGKGEKALSQTLLKAGISGSAEDIAEQATKYADDLVKEQQAILTAASAKGATVDTDKVLKPILKHAEKIESGVNLPSVKRSASGFRKDMAEVADMGRAVPEREIVEGFGEQGALFREAELPAAVSVPSLATSADEAIKAQYGIAQQVGMPESAMASQRLPDDELMRQAFASGKSRVDVPLVRGDEILPAGVRYEGPTQVSMFGIEPPGLTAIQGVSTGPAQQDLLSQAATASRRVSQPSVYDELLTQGKIAQGQVEAFSPGALMQPAKRTTIAGRPAASVADASRLKSQIYNLAGTQAYQEFAKENVGKSLLKRAGNRFKNAVERSVDSVDPVMGARLREVNKDLGNILSTRKVLQTEAGKEIAKNAITPVDTALLFASPAVAASKKVGDILKGTAFRTGQGKRMYQDNLGIYETLLNRSALGLPKGEDNGR